MICNAKDVESGSDIVPLYDVVAATLGHYVRGYYPKLRLQVPRASEEMRKAPYHLIMGQEGACQGLKRGIKGSWSVL